MSAENLAASGIHASSAVEFVGGRYQINEILGRGGMAVVYRATDSATGQEVALKQLMRVDDEALAREASALFEREFHTLAELSHPRIIETYDYGVDANGPYYTMEQLAGTDLQQRSPLEWRQACIFCHDICSSLALVHSRRLVHRDVSPRNIRCTPDGRAKLIDFGAMVPMGRSLSIVGTPYFVAPEVVHASALDGRTDIFSLGATLYYVLTGQPAYRARELSALFGAWQVKPTPPSRFVADIPEAVDSLVLSMLSLDPATRPQTAFDVMQRLAAIAQIESAEPASVSRAYLTTPVLVGRAEQLAEIREQLVQAPLQGGRSVLLVGPTGVGRSRMLDACVLQAKISGAAVLRASAIGGSEIHKDYLVAQALLEQLANSHPECIRAIADDATLETLFDNSEAVRRDGVNLAHQYVVRDLKNSPQPRLQRLQALTDCFFEVSRSTTIVIAIDDVERIDEPSAALLAGLASRASECRLVLMMTAEQQAVQTAGAALAVLRTNSERLTLAPLDRERTQELFASVFGDVPNLRLVSDGIAAVGAGIPRVCMDLARHLVDTGKVLYKSGAWRLPAQLDPGDLPDSVEDAMLARTANLGPVARALAEALALSSHGAFTREDFAVVGEGTEPSAIDAAITLLLFQEIVVSDGRYYHLAHGGWAPLLAMRLTGTELTERHRALARLYEHKPGVAVVRHLLACGSAERALDRLAAAIAGVNDRAELQVKSQLRMSEIAAILQQALDAAESIGRSAREINDLRRALVACSIGTDEAHYWRAAPKWLEQIRKDSGLNLAADIQDASSPAGRAFRIMQLAYERYVSLPEAERVYKPDDAIRFLIEYVLASISIGGKMLDTALLESIPSLLAPFAPLSPAVDAIWQNSIATCESLCYAQAEKARARWIELYERLGTMTLETLPSRDAIRHAIAAGIGSASARIGIESALIWAERIEREPLHQVHALYLRRAVSLQQGDWEAAEGYRRRAELLSLQAMVQQMFSSSLVSELDAHALANDLTGVRQVHDRIEPLATKSVAWRAYAHLADGHFERIRGNPGAACEAIERCLALASPTAATPNLTAWIFASGALVEALVELGRAEEARAAGEEALAVCRAREVGIVAAPITRALALAEARLCKYTLAEERLEALATEQAQLGVTGLQLGATYEARTRVAIWKGDELGIVEFSGLTARAYRHGQGSPLAARYERLQEEARRATDLKLPELSEFEAVISVVTQELSAAIDGQDRARRALALLCEAENARSGHLYYVSSNARVSHAASTANEPEPPGLFEYVSACLTHELDTDELETAAVSHITLEQDTNRPTFMASSGVNYRVVLLMAREVAVPCYVAIAAIVVDSTGSVPLNTPLASAIAQRLLVAGDTCGFSPTA